MQSNHKAPQTKCFGRMAKQKKRNVEIFNAQWRKNKKHNTR